MKNRLLLLGVVIVAFSMAAFGQLSGTYYIGTAGTRPGGGDPDYLSLKAACDAINANTGANITGDCIFYITSSLTETANVALGPNTNGHIVTFKPYTGITPTITFSQVADNTGLSGGWVMGVKNTTTTSATNYGVTQADSTEHIVIDGSNTPGGTTRDLSILTNAGISGNTNPIRIWGNCNYITLKNLVVVTGQSVSYAIAITNRNSTVAGATGNYTPDNVIVDNCDITNTFGSSGQGIGISNSNTPTQFPTGMIFRNNKISARTRGIFLYYSGDADVYGNQINVNQTTTGNLSEGIYAGLTGLSSNIINIYNNSILLLSTVNTTSGSYGIVGIYVNTQGVYNIYNNIITGFSFPNAAQGLYFGIGVSTGTANGITTNVYHNSVYMMNGSNTAGATPPIQTAFYLNLTGTSGTRVANVKNNIFANDEPDYATQAVYVTSGNLGTLNSDYNVLYTAGGGGKIGKYGATDCATLSDWQTASSQDFNSISGLPQYVSATDLHINPDASPTSVASNYGTPIVSVTTDIDANLRDLTYPDIGASEFTAHRGTIGSGTNTNLRINSPDTLLGNVTVTNVLTLNSTLTVGTDTLTVSNPIGGSPTNLLTDNTSSLVFNGTASGLAVPSSVSQLNNLTVNNVNGVALSSGITIAGTLTFTSGKLSAGNYPVTVSGTIVGAGSGRFVDGSLAISVPASGTKISKTWATGQGSDYLPFAVYFNSITGTDNVTVTAFDRTVTSPAGPINSSYNVLKRFYRVTKGSGIAAFATDSVQLSYSDADANALGIRQDTLKVYKFDGQNWSKASVSFIDTTANTITVTGVNSFSDFIITGSDIQGLASFSATAVAFSNVTVGLSKVDSIVVTNTGATSLNITSIASSSPTVTVSPLTATIAPAATQKFHITFAPTTGGALADTLLFSSNGASLPDTVFVSGTGILPTVLLSAISKDFGTVVQGNSKEDSVTISNSGPGDLLISSVSSDNTDFSVTPSGSATITSGSSAKYYITFHPTSLASLAGHIIFSHNNVPKSKDTVAVSGVGSVPGFGLSTSTMDIGNVRKSTSKIDSVIVSNSGSVAVSISSVTSDNAEFVVSPTSATVQPSGNETFTVTFTPTNLGLRTADIVFLHDGTLRDTLKAKGTGILPALALHSDSLNQGNVFLGKSKTDSIFVYNVGTDTLHVASVTVKNSQFAATFGDNVHFAVAPADSQKIHITFTPSALGLTQDTLVIAHDGPSVKDTIYISGTGVQANFAASPTSIAFSNVTVGSTKKDSAVVTNSGTGTLMVDSVKSDNALFTVSPTNAVIAPSGTSKFYFNFSPIATGAKTGNVVFYHNAPTLKDTVKLSGTGVQAAFAMAPTSISFGGVLSGQTKKDSVVVTNGGTSTLNIDSVRSDNAAFTITAPTSAIVAPAASYKFYITFGPTAVGAKNGNIVFYHNAPSKKDTMTVNGSGINQTFFTEDFTGSAGTSLTSAGWTISGSTTTNPISITAGSLTFGKYSGSGVGNAVTLASSGQDVYNSFPFINSGSAYLSVLVNVTSAGTGDYFIALSPTSSQTNYYARLHVKSSGTGYVVGVSKSNEGAGGAQYGSTVLSLNTTNLIVVKYTFVPDTANDAISVYAFTSTVPLTEPATPEIASYVAATKLDAANLGFITLRQGSTGAAPTLVIDGLRIGMTWTSGVPTGVLDRFSGIPQSYELYNNYPNPFNPSTTILYGLPRESRVSVKVYTLLGQEIRTLVNDVQNASYHRVMWNGRDNYGAQVSSGVYFFRIVAESIDGKAQSFVQVKKMMMMK